MASRIITKKGSGAPLASDLVHGELAVDTVNKRLYTENAGGTVIEVGTAPSTIDINAGTIDGTVIGGTTAAAGTFTTLTASGDVNFDSGTLFVDESENRVGVGTTTPTARIAVHGGANTVDDEAFLLDLKHDGSGAAGYQAVIRMGRPEQSNRRVLLKAIGTSTNFTVPVFAIEVNEAERFRISQNGDVSFYEDTGTTPKFFWNASAERLGIGTSSPANMLHLSNTSEGTHDLAFNRNTTYGTSTGLGGISWYNQAGDTKLTRIDSQTDGSATNTRLIFSTASGGTLAERMRLTSTGSLGIGTSSPAAKLEIGGAGEGIILASPDGTRYEITVANGGTLTVTAV